MRDDNASFFITIRDPVLALGTRRRCGGVGGDTVDVAAVAQCRHRGLSTSQTPLDHRDAQQQHSFAYVSNNILPHKTALPFEFY